MANINILSPFIVSWEGGFTSIQGDRGGYTNKGITLATWKAQGYDKDHDGDIDVQDLRLVTNEDFQEILRTNYWNRWKADEIQSQSVANLVVDWFFNSGVYGIKIPQRILGVAQDGIVGPKTLAAINGANPKELFERLKAARISYLENIVKRNPSQKKFLKGWLRRVESIRFSSLTLNTSPIRVTKWIE